MTCANAAVVFVELDIEPPVQAILDAPVVPDGVELPFGVAPEQT